MQDEELPDLVFHPPQLRAHSGVQWTGELQILSGTLTQAPAATCILTRSPLPGERFEEPVSYHLLQTSSFHNHSWVHLSSGWLGELQIHRWNSSSDAIIYLYPWSRGNFSNRELEDLERFLRVNSIGIQEFYTDYFMSEEISQSPPFLILSSLPPPPAPTSSPFCEPQTKPHCGPSPKLPKLPSAFIVFCFHLIPFSPFSPLIHDSSSPDPFDLQIATGCELHSGKGFLGLKHVATQGHDFMSFQNKTWSPSPEGGRKAQKVCKLLSQNQDYTQRLHRLLSDTCPRFTLGLLDAGKAHLQQQVKPEAWLSSGPSPGPGRLLLVCHVSGFYPKPVWVMWMRGEEEQQGTQRGDFLPNADGTWYLRAILDVAAGEAAGLACRVKHRSLGGQDLVLHWGAPHSALGWILLAVIVALALLTGLGFWFRKRWTHCEAPCSAVPLK
ncbi:T-cell surface glycoprotein CD1a-like [Marmota monax]|uniref:T-cell surface glycoprotein CD1a-like n=1 Tax=Marmota monax TaxID=9995 RepID=UPI0026F1C0DA|nr:T-cell surface glycoprotein CD1a-like [Marmota monax]